MQKIGRSYRVLKVFSIFFIILFQLKSFSQVKVSASVDKNILSSSDTVTLKVTVTSKDNVQVTPPSLPQLEDFDLLESRDYFQSSSSFENGQFVTERSQIYSYLLAPRKTGKLKIGPVEVVVNGETRLTKPILLDIEKASKRGRTAQRPTQPANPFDQMLEEEMDMFNQLLGRRGRGGSNFNGPTTSDDVFIAVDVDKTNVYVGEQIVATWYLYVKGAITDIDTLQYPSLSGFWKEDIELATRLSFTNQVVNGLMYRRALLASYALFPIKEGTIKIDSYRAKLSLAGMGFLGSRGGQVVTKQSEEVPIKVKPIPVDGRPGHFTGAVGKFKLTGKITKSEVKVNQPLSYVIKISGRGNVKRIDLPQLDLGEHVQLYDTIKKSEFSKSGDSQKTFELLLIPRDPGPLVIPSISLAFFDPDTAQFYEKSIPAFEVNVLPGEKGDVIQSTPLADAGNVVNGQGKEPVNVMPGLMLSWQSANGIPLTQQMSIWAVFLAFALIILLWRYFVEFGLLKKEHQLQDEVKKRMIHLNNCLNRNDWRQVGVHGGNLIYHILGELSGQGGASREIDTLLKMAPPSVRMGLGTQLKQSLEFFELLGFAPDAVVVKYSEASNVKLEIKKLERALLKAVKESDSVISNEVEGSL